MATKKKMTLARARRNAEIYAERLRKAYDQKDSPDHSFRAFARANIPTLRRRLASAQKTVKRLEGVEARKAERRAKKLTHKKHKPKRRKGFFARLRG